MSNRTKLKEENETTQVTHSLLTLNSQLKDKMNFKQI